MRGAKAQVSGLDFAEKGRSRCREWPSLIAEDRSMAAIRHDPKRPSRNRAVQLDREFHRIQRIAITVDGDVTVTVLILA